MDIVRQRTLQLIAVLALALGPAAASAAGPADAAGGLETKDFKIQTGVTKMNFGTHDFTMPNRVRFYRPGTDAVGDRAYGNYQNGTVVLLGNVVVHDSGSASEGGAAYAGAGPATLTCDRLEIDSHKKVYTAIGNVHFSQGTRRGSADRGMLDRTSNVLQLSGNVNLNDAASSVTADRVDDNLQSKDVVISGGPAVLKQQNSSGGVDAVQAAELHWNQNSGDFTIPGKATFTRPGTDATGDRATGNTKAGTLELAGNVVVHDSGSAPEASTEKSYAGHGPATLTTDTLQVDAKQKIYTAIGNVHFEQGADTGKADRGTLNRGNNTLTLDGNVKMTEGPSSMTARSVAYNLQTKDVTVLGAPIIIKQPVPAAAPGAPKPTAKPKKKP